jgi:adenosylcobinamide-GDP ribazoletransferase
LPPRLRGGGWEGGHPPATLADSAWVFPVVGAVVGAVGALAYWPCAFAMAPAVAAAWALAVMLLATGALHEDGLADTADGFGGGRTPERKREIMRDSRIGAFGALALTVTLAARGAALASLAAPGRVAAALVVAGALGRGAILVLLLLLRPARPDGLASGLGESAAGRSAIGLLLAAAFAFVLLPFGAACWSCGAAVVAAAALAWAAHRQIGGYTGDVLGAASVLAECAVLGVLSGG